MKLKPFEDPNIRLRKIRNLVVLITLAIAVILLLVTNL